MNLLWMERSHKIMVRWAIEAHRKYRAHVD